jgi:HTH-type transcriptional regulator/antitoxin HipB
MCAISIEESSEQSDDDVSCARHSLSLFSSPGSRILFEATIVTMKSAVWLARDAHLRCRYLTNTCLRNKSGLLAFQVFAMPSRSHVLATASQLGSILQAARKARGMTQSALAARLGLSQSRVSYLELSPHDLSLAQLLAWCSTLDLELTIGARGKAPPQTDW